MSPLTKAGRATGLRPALVMLSVLSLSAAADPEPPPLRLPQAAPCPPPPIVRAERPHPPEVRQHGPLRYGIGDPTDEEQYALELINRARAHPAAEGRRWSSTTQRPILEAMAEFAVDREMLLAEFERLTPSPPLAFHPALLAAARAHSSDMFANAFQGHTGSDGRTLADRLTAVGYPYSTAAENVFGHGKDLYHGHAALQISWGPGLGGMHGPPRRHRDALHHPGYREIGLGLVQVPDAQAGTLPVGPWLITQTFGARAGAGPLLTGVAYYDLNGNGHYDRGEGLGGVQVTIEGLAVYATTTATGGYALPVPGDGLYWATFSGPELPSQRHQLFVSQGENVRLDYRPVYTPPSIIGPERLIPGQFAPYSFSPVGGAMAYAWTESREFAYTRVEGAEQGIDHLLLSVSANYQVQDFRVAASGNASFHLAITEPRSQTLELPDPLRPGPTAQLLFASRLGYAFTNQVARAQVSTDHGQSWVDVWQRPGDTTDPHQPRPGQLSFEPVAVSLGAYAGSDLRVRFHFSWHEPGGFFHAANANTGWHFDDIRFSGVSTLTTPITRAAAPDGFGFRPMTEGVYRLRVQPQVSGRWFPAGPEKQVVVAGAPLPTSRIDTIQWTAQHRLQLDLTIAHGPPESLHLETRSSLLDHWTPVELADWETLVPGSRYRCTVDALDDRQRFFRVFTLP